MNTTIVEDIEGTTKALVEHWRKLPDDQIRSSGVPESRFVTPEQQRLLRALASLIAAWPVKEAAKNIELSFGFLEKLRELKPGKPVILTVDCPEKFQVEFIRLSEVLKTEAPFDCKQCCCRNGQFYCCAYLSVLEESK